VYDNCSSTVRYVLVPTVSYRIVSYRIVSHRIVSYRIAFTALYRIVLYCIVQTVPYYYQYEYSWFQ